jgi:hypothetical protein
MRGDFIKNFLHRNCRLPIPLLLRFRRVEYHLRKIERPRKSRAARNDDPDPLSNAWSTRGVFKQKLEQRDGRKEDESQARKQCQDG